MKLKQKPVKTTATPPDNKPYWETDSFKKLSAAWDVKLDKAGFTDIEMGHEPNRFLKRWDASWFANRPRGWQNTQAQQVYYQECDRYLHDYPFKTELDKKIWEMHADGATIAQTAKALKLKPGNVRNIVNAIKQELLREFKYGPERRN